MALAKTIKFSKVVVLLESSTTPGTYSAPCGVESLTMTVNVETETTNAPDCANPDLASWLETDIVSQQMTIEGEGVLDSDAMQEWQKWWYGTLAGQTRNVRFFRDLTAINGGGNFTGPAVLTAYSESGQRGQRWRNSFTITFSGKPAFTAAV